jgi:hypothetical protein
MVTSDCACYSWEMALNIGLDASFITFRTERKGINKGGRMDGEL